MGAAHVVLGDRVADGRTERSGIRGARHALYELDQLTHELRVVPARRDETAR